MTEDKFDFYVYKVKQKHGDPYLILQKANQTQLKIKCVLHVKSTI